MDGAVATTKGHQTASKDQSEGDDSEDEGDAIDVQTYDIDSSEQRTFFAESGRKRQV